MKTSEIRELVEGHVKVILDMQAQIAKIQASIRLSEWAINDIVKNALWVIDYLDEGTWKQSRPMSFEEAKDKAALFALVHGVPSRMDYPSVVECRYVTIDEKIIVVIKLYEEKQDEPD